MGRGPWSRVTGCIKRYAPSRIIYIILNRLQKAVSQKVILSWLIFDILVSIGLLVFYLLFRDLAALGFFKSRKLWLVSVARLLLLFFGVSVVLNRRHKNGEAFFCTFLVNMVLFIAFLVPIERLVCDCRTGTWAQCNAAQSFKYPEGTRYNPYRPMPIDEDQKREKLGPDTRMQKAEPPDILYVLRPPRSSSLLQEVVSQEPSLRLPKRLLGKKALHQAGNQQSMLMLDAPDESKESKKSKEPENPTEAENSKPENPTEPENSKPQNPTEAENSKPESPTEPENSKPQNPTEAENPTEPENSKGPGKSEEPAKTKESEDTPHNISKACRDVFPKGIPETLTADDLAALNDLPVLLDLRQSLPEKVTQDLDEAEQQKITELLHELCDEHMGTLGRMPKADKAETEKQALYMTDLIELNAREQVKALDQHFRRTCRCEGHSSCNWYSYGAHMTMWCYVAESSVPWCHLEGIQLFKDTKNKTWTVDLCQEGSCKCAGLGMPAEDEDTVDADNPLIQKNPIYYGYKCGKWRNGDTLSWCWAGMDTSCFNRDRPLPPDYKTSNWPKGMLYMFRSVEPCSNNNLGQGPGGRLEPALQLCEYLQVSLEIFMYLYLICMFPMGGIIFKFICNRCGDAIQTEHQFQAYDTSEDSDDPGAAAAAAPPGSAGAGAAGAAGGAGAAPARDSFTAWEGSR